MRRLPNNTLLEDLISTGIVGLINAIDGFDPSYNVQLKTYAEHKIRGAILDSIRGLDGVQPHKRKRMKEIQATMERSGATLPACSDRGRDCRRTRRQPDRNIANRCWS